MNLNKRDFIMTVNLIMFKVDDRERINTKRRPKKELMALLMKRKRDPYKDCWLFPYAFVDIEESLDDAVYRILIDKTHLENIYFEQLYTWGAVNRDPSARVIATSYMAVAPTEQIKAQAIEENDELKWFSVAKKLLSTERISDLQVKAKYLVTLFNRQENITISYQVDETTSVNGFEKRTKYSYAPSDSSRETMAYDHIKILDYALDRIKNKVLYTNIAFGLIPTHFTLTELQQVYEVLLGKELIKPNFRQMIRKKVESTQETKKDGAYRPSKLYQLKKSSIIEWPEIGE